MRTLNTVFTSIALILLSSVLHAGVDEAVKTKIPLESATVSDILNNLVDLDASSAKSALSESKENAVSEESSATKNKNRSRRPYGKPDPSIPTIGYVPTEQTNKADHHRLFTQAENFYFEAQALSGSAPKRAQGLLTKALSINPRHTKARLALGSLLAKNIDPQAAIAVLQPLLYKDNTDWRPWFWYGSALLQTSDLDNAATVLDQALLRERREPAVWIQRAIVEHERGASENALQLLKTAARFSVQDDPTMALNLAVVASSIDGMGDTSQYYYEQYLDLQKESSQNER